MVTICIVEPSSLSPYNPGSPWNLEGFETTNRTYSHDRNKFSGHHSQLHPVHIILHIHQSYLKSQVAEAS